MNIKTLLGSTALAVILSGCDSGGVTLAPSNNVSNSNNTTNTGTTPAAPLVNPCASYQKSGQTIQGTLSGANCIYPNTFVSDTNPLSADLTINELANNGIHIFEDSLFVGQDVNANAAAQGVKVPQDGEGPDLVLAPGVKIAFSNPEDYIRINRGSRIIADGTRTKPIILSAIKDLRDKQATEADRGLWGGLVINGNGLTNKCTDAERQATASNPHNCHVTTEGRPSTYGGNNNAENSGVLRYVQVRYAGFEVVDGDELNGITFNGVGSGTTVEYVQVYTTQDDGYETFGGAVSFKNIVAVNVGDDYLDFSEGWVGDVQFALFVITSGGNRCVEADNTGDTRPDDVAPYTKGRISNMTCIVTDVDAGQGQFPSTKGDAEGPLYREGSYFEQYNSITVASTATMASNECFEIESAQSIAGIGSGFSVARGNLVACSEALKAVSSFNIRDWWTTSGNVVVNEAARLPVTALKGLGAANPRAYITAPAFTDATGAAITVPVYDVTQLRDSWQARAVPAVGAAGSSSFFQKVDFIGAVKDGQDWVSGWTTGL